MDQINALRLLDARTKRIKEFRAMPQDEEENKGAFARNVAIGAGAGTAATGAVVGAHVLGKRVLDRVGGLRATVPGFTQRSRAGQVAGRRVGRGKPQPSSAARQSWRVASARLYHRGAGQEADLGGRGRRL